MKRKLHLLAGAVLLMATAQFSGCSSDDDFLMMEPIDPQTRATVLSDDSITITFEDFDSSMMAMPTSYGDNYYGTVGEYTQVTNIMDGNGFFKSEVNTINGVQAFYNGGIALSKWNYYCNPTDTTAISKPSGELSPDWWYSYYNQMSVYNTNSTSGENCSAGHSGDNFGVVYGYQDQYNSSYMAMPEFTFVEEDEDENENLIERNIQYMYVCNSAYTYGVIINGNWWDDGEDDGWVGTAQSLVTSKGWFKVLAYGYDANGNATNGGNPVEFYLADYRDNSSTATPAIEKWTKWDLSALGSVAKIKFNFEGSDTGQYGLNTPAYVCIDDITFN